MLADLPDEEFQALKAALEARQRAGQASPPGAISYRELAEAYRTNRYEIRLIEQTALLKLRSALEPHRDLLPLP